MDFEIAAIEDAAREVRYSINKCGNKYDVRAHGDKSGRFASREFENLKEAYEVFEKIVSWVVFGMYANKDRMDFIENGTME